MSPGSPQTFETGKGLSHHKADQDHLLIRCICHWRRDEMFLYGFWWTLGWSQSQPRALGHWCLMPRATFPPHHAAETVSHSVMDSRHTCLGLLVDPAQTAAPGDGLSVNSLNASSFFDTALQYEPVITAGNEALVHHMEVFQCAAEFDSFPHYNGPCDSKMKPDRLNYCRHVLAAWAMGAQVGARWDPLPWVKAFLLDTFLLSPNPS